MTSASLLQLPILMYHEIADRSETDSSLAVSPRNFQAQLAYLHDRGFKTIAASDVPVLLARGPSEIPDRTVVLTFDDGYEDFHSRAIPLLHQHGFTATVFVTVGWVQDSRISLAGQERPGRMLSWSQVREVAATGIEVGAHSCLHPQLDQIRESRLRDELYVSKGRLEDKLGHAVPGLAYPFGYSNARVRQVARDAGYAYACAVRNMTAQAESDPFALPRLTVRRSTTMFCIPSDRSRPGPDDVAEGPGADSGLGYGAAVQGSANHALGSRWVSLKRLLKTHFEEI